MTFVESVRTALRVLRGHPMRSALTMLGIIVGVAAVVSTIASGQSALIMISETIRQLGTDVLYVLPGAASSGGAQRAVGTQHTLTDDDVAAILREMPEVQIAAPIVQQPGQIIAGGRNWSTTVYGTDPGYLLAREWPLAEGRSFSSVEMETGAKAAIIGQVIVDKVFGGDARIGDSFRIDRTPFVVIGILQSKGQTTIGSNQDDLVVVPISTARNHLLAAARRANRQALNSIILKLYDSDHLPEIKATLTEIIRHRHSLRTDAPDDFSIYNPTDLLAAQQKAVDSLTIFMAAVAAVSLLVGGISIMNIMLVSVTERTREIGLRIAVGAQRRDIRNQFLIEAVTLALLGGMIGALIGCVWTDALAALSEWPMLISPSLVLFACTVAALVGLASGYYPAYRASRLDPMVALRFE